MNGNQFQKITLSLSANKTILLIAEMLLLFGIGMLAITLHARLRIPLHLSGHHGIEFMAIFVAGRMFSKIPTASSISSLGVGSLLFVPILGFHDPFMSLVFMLPGFVLDLFCYFTNKWKSSMLFIALVAGLAYATIPVSRMIIHLVTGYPYGSLITGLLYPLFTHFIFGFIGGLLGSGVYRSFKLFRKT